MMWIQLILMWHLWIHPIFTWRRHQMETFSALLALCAGNSPVTGEFPSQRPVTQSFEIFFDVRLNKRMIKKSIRRWIETKLRSLCRYCNDMQRVVKTFDVHMHEQWQRCCWYASNHSVMMADLRLCKIVRYSSCQRQMLSFDALCCFNSLRLNDTSIRQ